MDPAGSENLSYTPTWRGDMRRYFCAVAMVAAAAGMATTGDPKDPKAVQIAETMMKTMGGQDPG